MKTFHKVFCLFAVSVVSPIYDPNVESTVTILVDGFVFPGPIISLFLLFVPKHHPLVVIQIIFL